MPFRAMAGGACIPGLQDRVPASTMWVAFQNRFIELVTGLLAEPPDLIESLATDGT